MDNDKPTRDDTDVTARDVMQAMLWFLLAAFSVAACLAAALWVLGASPGL
jgi:hypothetical protein